ncbi:MAG: DUF3795 domain-containing protein [Oscillospiraceae bacterium]|nr:DUF3795 domain-containing protein [Oscillospiraceae bacterium]
MKLSSCGIDCESCEYFINKKCEGCYVCAPKGQCVWGGNCDLYECAANKNLPHCGMCDDFPCDMLKEWASSEGTERIENLKKREELQ